VRRVGEAFAAGFVAAGFAAAGFVAAGFAAAGFAGAFAGAGFAARFAAGLAGAAFAGVVAVAGFAAAFAGAAGAVALRVAARLAAGRPSSAARRDRRSRTSATASATCLRRFASTSSAFCSFFSSRARPLAPPVRSADPADRPFPDFATRLLPHSPGAHHAARAGLQVCHHPQAT
jgi:hypothetical protein